MGKINARHVLACSDRRLTERKVAENMGISLGLSITIVTVNWACVMYFREVNSTVAE
jgi:hypothetical protein